MTQENLHEISSKLRNLEQECQNNINITDNMKNMENLIKDLSVYDILQLAEYMETSNCKM